MNLDGRIRAILIIFLEGVIVYFITSFLIIGPLFRGYFAGEPAVGELPFLTSYISLGIAVGFTTIALAVYPVFKFRQEGEQNEQ
ncbi:MAG: hypothetical protein ACP5UO_04045 [Thermoplasmata archaeon]